MRKLYFLSLFTFLLFVLNSKGQTVKLAVEYFENLDKAGDIASTAFIEYASDRFLSKKEKAVAKKKARLLDIVQNQKEKVSNEMPFNGQLRLKNGYINFLTKLQQFPDNLEPYTELTIKEYQTGVAQKRKLALLAQVELVKSAANDLNTEVNKYITMNKLRDFKKTSTLPEKFAKAVTILNYSQKIRNAVLTIAALDRNFYDTLALDSLGKAEAIRKSILQNSASLGGSIKIPSPIPTDFSIREAAINSINMYRQDAFRNLKLLVDTRKKEVAFKKKYPNGLTGKSPSGAVLAKYETEKSQLETQLSDLKKTVVEMKRDRDKHEKAFDEYLVQFVERWNLSE